MTVVRPNSISGINSITVQSGQSLSIHDSGGNLIREIVSNTGFSTVSGLSVGSAVTAKDYGVHITGVTTSTGGLYVGTAATIFASGNATFSGITTTAGSVVQGRLLVNQSSNYTVYGDNKLQISATDGTAGLSVTRWSNNGSSPYINLGKSRGAEGAYTVVQDDDRLGQINFTGADGTDLASHAASIAGYVDGTPGSNDMPGRLVFATSSDGGVAETERLRIDSSGRLLVGTTAARDVGGLSSQKLAIEGTDGPSSALSLIDNQNSAGGSPSLCFAKSRGTSVGSNTIVQNGDTLGAITWCAADGNDIANQSAKIYCNVDAAPGSNDTAGRLIFSTSEDGSSSPSSRLEINKDGHVYVKTGSVVISTAGQGNDFSASGGPQGSGTELLDDYEEGSFTPTVTASSSTGTISYTNQYGFYTKVGNLVNLWIMLNYSESGSSGDLQVTSLPFTNNSTTGSYAVGAFQCNDMEDSYQSNVGQYTPYMAPGGTVITFRGTKTNGGGFESMAMQGMNYLRIQHTYRSA